MKLLFPSLAIAICAASPAIALQSGGGQDASKFERRADLKLTAIEVPARSDKEAKDSITINLASQIMPFWARCPISGAEIDKLRALVRFRMNKAGKIIGIDPPIVTGQNEANASAAEHFGECAVEALRQVGTFTGLPADRYDLWQSYEFEFRKR